MNPPFNMGNPMPNPMPNQMNDDQSVMDKLKKLVSSINDKARQKALFRLFEALNDPDDESNFDAKLSEQKLWSNLINFRKLYPMQKPLFKNIGYVAQKIKQDQFFFQNIDQPELPPPFKAKSGANARIFILVLHQEKEITLKPQNIDHTDCFLVAKFFELKPTQQPNQANQNRQVKNPMIPNQPPQQPHPNPGHPNQNPQNSAEIVAKDGNVTVDGQQIDPITIGGQKYYILAKAPCNQVIKIRFSPQNTNTIFNWLSVQYAQINPEYHAKISHSPADCCIIDSYSVVDKNTYDCPQCHKKYKNSMVSFEQGPLERIPPSRQPSQKQQQIQQQMQMPYSQQQMPNMQQSYRLSIQQMQQQMHQNMQQSQISQIQPQYSQMQPQMQPQMQLSMQQQMQNTMQSQMQQQIQPQMQPNMQQNPQFNQYNQQQPQMGYPPQMQRQPYQYPQQQMMMMKMSTPSTPQTPSLYSPKPNQMLPPQPQMLPPQPQPQKIIDETVWKELMAPVKNPISPPTVLDDKYDSYWIDQYQNNTEYEYIENDESVF